MRPGSRTFRGRGLLQNNAIKVDEIINKALGERLYKAVPAPEFSLLQ